MSDFVVHEEIQARPIVQGGIFFIRVCHMRLEQE
jgi:hypothetical protein